MIKQLLFRNSLIALFVFLSFPLICQLCDYSYLQLNSATPNGNGLYDISLDICAGAGYGGANQNTASFAIILYGGATFDNYPPSISSNQTGGIGSADLYAADTLIYINTGAYWTCISNICGGPQSICTTISITTDGLPNAIFLIGMEGAGNPWGSCMDSDMYVFPDPNDVPDICELVSFDVDAGSDKTVYYGYDPMACASLSASISGSHANPVTYSWSNGFTGQSTTVCPSTNTTYSVTATDSEGCEVISSVNVDVIDVRCGKKNDKVLMCDTNKGETKCEKQNKVQSKLDKGWTIGPCTNLNTDLIASRSSNNSFLENVFQLNVFPTVFNHEVNIHLQSIGNREMKIQLFDLNGIFMKNIYVGSWDFSNRFKLRYSTTELPSGMYFIRAIADNEEVQMTKLIKMD